MSIRYLKKYAALDGNISVEDAETLAQWLQKQPAPAVHLNKCEHLHGAALQVLLALRPQVKAPPPDPWLAQVLASAVR